MRAMEVWNTTRSTLLGNSIQVADRPLTRLFGLLGKRPLSEGEGLWISPSSGVHTVGMSFSIDVVGLDREDRIVHLWPVLVPYRFTKISFAIKSVLELPAGTIRKACCEPGDQILLKEVK